jgi:WD40 repeat protein
VAVGCYDGIVLQKHFFFVLADDLNACSYIIDVTWSPDGKWLASGSNDRTVRICQWTLSSTGTWVCQSTTVDSGVISIAFFPDGSKIAAAYLNKIQLFDVQTQEKLGSPLTGHSGSV